jgi:hypothetical protein
VALSAKARKTVATFGAQGSPAPPRGTAGIAAILDQQKPDAAEAAGNRLATLAISFRSPTVAAETIDGNVPCRQNIDRSSRELVL